MVKLVGDDCDSEDSFRIMLFQIVVKLITIYFKEKGWENGNR